MTSAGDPGRRTPGRPLARQAAFLAPRELQKDRRREPLIARPTVPPTLPGCDVASAVTAIPSSVSMPRSANGWATSRIPARSGSASPPRSTTTTFAPSPRASPSHSACMIHRPTAVRCSSASATRPPPLLSLPSPAGGGREGRLRYPNAQHLPILADTGGSHSATRGAWKDQLQQHLCDRLGLTVTVAHYPAGASKYNPIERRLFSPISKNWAAEPLTDYDKILSLIRGATTTTGLRVRAYLDTKEYPLKVKPSAQRLRELRITRHTTLPKWNYTIAPSNWK